MSEQTATGPRRPSRRMVLGAGIPAAVGVLAVGAIGSPWPARLGEATGDGELAEALAPHLDGHRHVSAAVIDGDEVRFAGFGADEHREYEVASISKTFTAALVMDAVDRGELTLETTVEDVLGSRASGTGVADRTIAQLASHTSGIPRLPPSMLRRLTWDTPLRKNPYRDLDGESVIDAALEVEVEEPGTYQYSNLATALEGHLVASAAGSTWHDLLAERLLEPLGLASTRAPRTEQELGAGDVSGHLANGHGAEPWVMDGYAPTGGVRSTAADVTTWVRSMIDGSNPGTNGLEPIADLGEGQQIAVHWHLQTVETGTAVWHNGENAGFHSFCGFVPETGRGVVLLSDTANASIDALGLGVLEGTVAA